jgi:hypothetical protein
MSKFNATRVDTNTRRWMGFLEFQALLWNTSRTAIMYLPMQRELKPQFL